MNNEPVAWMDGEGGFYHNDDYEVCKEHNIADDLIPLYTHPAEHDLGIAEAIGFEKGHKSAEDMLRQQQAEIEALKEQLKPTRHYSFGYEYPLGGKLK